MRRNVPVRGLPIVNPPLAIVGRANHYKYRIWWRRFQPVLSRPNDYSAQSAISPAHRHAEPVEESAVLRLVPTPNESTDSSTPASPPLGLMAGGATHICHTHRYAEATRNRCFWTGDSRTQGEIGPPADVCPRPQTIRTMAMIAQIAASPMFMPAASRNWRPRGLVGAARRAASRAVAAMALKATVITTRPAVGE